MGYASISGRARTDVNNPKAFAVCDRCGLWYNHVDLRWQFDYRGRTLANIRILVCETCEDDPQPQLKPRIIPPDPIPIKDARVEPFFYDEQDERYTTNPALPNVSVGTTENIFLAGFQIIDSVQVVEGDLVLVKNQTDTTKNGIYRVTSSVWRLMAFDNDNKVYITATERGAQYYGQLGYYLGAVNIARGARQQAQLYQITFENPSALLSAGTPVLIGPVAPSSVNHYDFWTGIFMPGADVRVTQENDVRSTQIVGQASGNTNEIPGYSNLVPGACDIGRPDEVPYGSASQQGLPSGFDSLPYSGALWPTLQNQSIGVWLNSRGQACIWLANNGLELTFESSGFWPNPGPGAPQRIIEFAFDGHKWVNQYGQIDVWNNASNEDVEWRNGNIYGVFPPGGDILWLTPKCEFVNWYNVNTPSNNSLPSPLVTGQPPFVVNFAQIYQNGLE